MKYLTMLALACVFVNCATKSSDGPVELCQSEIECLPFEYSQFLNKSGFVAHEGLEMQECRMILEGEGSTLTPFQATSYLISPRGAQTAVRSERIFFLSQAWRDAHLEPSAGIISMVRYVDTQQPTYRASTTFECGNQRYTAASDNIWVSDGFITKPASGVLESQRDDFSSMRWQEYIDIALSSDVENPSSAAADDSYFQPQLAEEREFEEGDDSE